MDVSADFNFVHFERSMDVSMADSCFSVLFNCAKVHQFLSLDYVQKILNDGWIWVKIPFEKRKFHL